MANPWHWMRGLEGTGPEPVAFGAKMTKEEVEAEEVKISPRVIDPEFIAQYEKQQAEFRGRVLSGTVPTPASPPPVSQVSRETEKLSRETNILPPATQAVEKPGEDWQESVYRSRTWAELMPVADFFDPENKS